MFTFRLPSGHQEDKAEILRALDEATQEDNWGYVPLSGPYVDEQFSLNVSVQVDKTAVLNCRILYIVGKTVSGQGEVLTCKTYSSVRFIIGF